MKLSVFRLIAPVILGNESVEVEAGNWKAGMIFDFSKLWRIR
jgi:hypothetical protein